jgi:hypothetical protein
VRPRRCLTHAKTRSFTLQDGDDEAEWRRVLAVNLTAVLEGARLATQRWLAECEDGTRDRVLLLTSSASAFFPLPAAEAYTAAKAGVVALARAMAPLQRKGVTPTHDRIIIKGFVDQLQAFRPANLGEQALFSESLSQLNTLLALRSARLASVNSGIPDILWAVVLIGALINIVLLWMIKTERHVHIIITGTLSAFMGLVIFLIAAMDYPFRGEVSIDAAPFEQVYTKVMETERPAS